MKRYFFSFKIQDNRKRKNKKTVSKRSRLFGKNTTNIQNSALSPVHGVFADYNYPFLC